MNLIKISQDVLVNTDKIDSVRRERQPDGTESIEIIVEGIPYKIDPKVVNWGELMTAGVDLTKQFWAG